MQNPEQHLKNSTLVMKIVGWLCMAGLPAFAMLYPPGVLWGSVSPDVCFPQLIDHPPSPYNGLHPYFYMVAAMYVSYGFLMLRGAKDPVRNSALFDYGIASNLLHGTIMIPMAFYYPNEHAHMWFDIPFAYAVVALCLKWHPAKLENRMGMFWWVPFGKVPEISAAQLDVWRNDGTAQILDVRTGPEYRSSHVPGALHTPVTDFGAQLAALQLDKSRPVVAICLSAHRSIPAVRALQEQGFRNACQLEGGMLAWWKAKLPTEGDGSVDARAANALQKGGATQTNPTTESTDSTTGKSNP